MEGNKTQGFKVEFPNGICTAPIPAVFFSPVWKCQQVCRKSEPRLWCVDASADCSWGREIELSWIVDSAALIAAHARVRLGCLRDPHWHWSRNVMGRKMFLNCRSGQSYGIWDSVRTLSLWGMPLLLTESVDPPATSCCTDPRVKVVKQSRSFSMTTFRHPDDQAYAVSTQRKQNHFCIGGNLRTKLPTAMMSSAGNICRFLWRTCHWLWSLVSTGSFTRFRRPSLSGCTF